MYEYVFDRKRSMKNRKHALSVIDDDNDMKNSPRRSSRPPSQYTEKIETGLNYE